METGIDTLIKKVYQYANRRQFNLGEGEQWIKKRIERRLINFQRRESIQSQELEMKFQDATQSLNS